GGPGRVFGAMCALRTGFSGCGAACLIAPSTTDAVGSPTVNVVGGGSAMLALLSCCASALLPASHPAQAPSSPPATITAPATMPTRFHGLDPSSASGASSRVR